MQSIGVNLYSSGMEMEKNGDEGLEIHNSTFHRGWQASVVKFTEEMKRFWTLNLDL